MDGKDVLLNKGNSCVNKGGGSMRSYSNSRTVIEEVRNKTQGQLGIAGVPSTGDGDTRTVAKGKGRGTAQLTPNSNAILMERGATSDGTLSIKPSPEPLGPHCQVVVANENSSAVISKKIGGRGSSPMSPPTPVPLVLSLVVAVGGVFLTELPWVCKNGLHHDREIELHQ